MADGNMAGRDRVIPLDGSFNFRELGGYPAADGRVVAWGRLFRSDDLFELTREDREMVRRLGIRTVIDFRDKGEASASPDRLPDSVVHRRHLPIEVGKLAGGVMDGRLTREKAVGMMVSVYRLLVHDFQFRYREFFEIVLDGDSQPLLFHCTAGKDRTGLAGALLLSGLGVERETVVGDYLLSAEYLKNKYQAGFDYDAVMEPLYSVRPEFIETALEVIDDNYNGMDAFLTNQLNVDIEKLRTMYLV